MKYLLSLLLLLSASVFVSCEKDENKTPRPTPRTEKELLEEYRARYPQLDLSAKADQRVQTLLGPTRRLTEAEMHKALDGTSWVLHVERKIKTDGALEPYMGWFSHIYGSLTFNEGKVRLTETAALPNRPEAPFETYTYDEKKNEIKANDKLTIHIIRIGKDELEIIVSSYDYTPFIAWYYCRPIPKKQ